MVLTCLPPNMPILPPQAPDPMAVEFERMFCEQLADGMTQDNEDQAEEQGKQLDADKPDEAIDEESDNESGSIIVGGASKDNPDPFMLANITFNNPIDLSLQPPHLQAIYALVTWLWLQFHLPQVACQVTLAILACILFFLSPMIQIPLVTLASANRILSLNVPIHILPVCPTCKEVYPDSNSTEKDCQVCQSPLFKLDLTWCGKLQKNRIPLLCYPYLSISEQLSSIFSVPGVKDLLDQWRTKS